MLLKWIFSLFVFLYLPLPNYAYNAIPSYPGLLQKIENTSLFNGDRHGKFKGNLVAYLSDGSEWKIHPKDEKKYSQWHSGETVFVKPRTDFYWFSRQHHFLLFNENRQEEAKAMLIWHKNNPYELRIIESKSYATAEEWVTDVDSFEEVNSDGNIVKKERHRTRSKPCNFETFVQLSDGSSWILNGNWDDIYRPGLNVYIGAQGNNGIYYNYIMIVGTQREAFWLWANPKK